MLHLTYQYDQKIFLSLHTYWARKN